MLVAFYYVCLTFISALVNILYDPKRLVDRAEFRVSLADFLDLREGRFLLERLNALGVRTKRGLLALGLLFILDNEHDELIRLALGLKSDGRNWRIFGYILQDMVTADVQRVQPDYADCASLLFNFSPKLTCYQLLVCCY